jgi:hypothetical protein
MPLEGLRQGRAQEEYVRLRKEWYEASDTCWKLRAQLPDDPPIPVIDEDELAEFAERLRDDRHYLCKTAERILFQWYAGYVFNPKSYPCHCKLALPECDCISRFKPSKAPGALPIPLKPKRPKAGKVLAKRNLFSGKQPGWWREKRYSGSRRHDDEITRAHDKAAGVGMQGFYAGGKGVWKNDQAEYFPDRDDRASTRDLNKTAKQGERELQKPYNDPLGTSRSWNNPSDIEPDNDKGIFRIGRRVIEEGTIDPPKHEDEN